MRCSDAKIRSRLSRRTVTGDILRFYRKLAANSGRNAGEVSGMARQNECKAAPQR